jgi:hypothetical protein
MYLWLLQKHISGATIAAKAERLRTVSIIFLFQKNDTARKLERRGHQFFESSKVSP